MVLEHGLPYELAGVVGAGAVLTAMARAHRAAMVVPLDSAGLWLLPVTAELAAEATPAALCVLGLAELPGGKHQAACRRAGLLTGPESGFNVLTPGLVALIEAGSTIGPVAYVKADYLGQEGRQAAAIWRAGNWGSRLSPDGKPVLEGAGRAADAPPVCGGAVDVTCAQHGPLRVRICLDILP